MLQRHAAPTVAAAARVIEGTEGTVLVDRDGYEVYDLRARRPTNSRLASRPRPPDLIGARLHDRPALRELHRRHPQGRKLNAPVSVGNVAVTMLQLSNIAW